MSLFPAYASDLIKQESCTISSEPSPTHNELSNVKDTAKISWLDNASFLLEVSQIPLPLEQQSLDKPVETLIDLTSKSSESNEDLPLTGQSKHVKKTIPEVIERKRSFDDDEHRHRSTKRKRLKSKRHHHKSSRKSCDLSTPKVEEGFYTDKKKERGNLKVCTLTRPVIPLYHIKHHYILGQLCGQVGYRKQKSSKKSRHKDRYFTLLVDEDQGVANTGGNTNPETSKEEELSKQTALFNRTLGDEPHNVEVWLQYVKFQDTVWQFERTYRRGGGAQGTRVTAERKLAIIDKGLTYNPDSELLLLERGQLAEAVFPADELSQQFANQLEQRPKSMSLWRSFINATQFSLSLCSISKVTELYGKAMMCFHQARRGAPTAQTQPAEENILDLLLQCGLFLRQAGLSEQMWMLLHHCLELNLIQPSPDHFKVNSTIPEETVMEMEETVLASDLPLPELWLRVEQLRESVHWLPWNSDEQCEDPQRLVFADDVSDMLHPITTPDLSFRLAATVITLLKVPLLPCRDSALQLLGVTQIPWAVDSVEILLTAVFPFGTVDCGVSSLLSQAAELVVGPSFLSYVGQNVNLGQEHYLDFVTKVFRACGDCLKEPARTAWFVWWLRFEKFLIILGKNNLCKLPGNRKKKLKTSVKDFLKHDLNRNNLLFYREYALIEKEFGNQDTACNILCTTISTQHPGEPVIGVTDRDDRARLCYLYRTLCELFLTSGDSKIEKHKRAINLLVALSLGVTQPTIGVKFSLLDQNSAIVKFRHITDELLNDPEMMIELAVNGAEHLLPDFLVDWVTCHSWLLFLAKSTWEAAALLEDVLAKLTPQPQDVLQRIVTKNTCRREALFESYISLLHQHCQEISGSFSVLHDVVQRALKEFPNNVHFLASAARVESSEASPWWKLKRLFDDADSQLSRIFLVLLAKQRQSQLEDLDMTNLSVGVLAATVSDASYKNRTSSLFRQLITHPSSRRCPLIWRLYLKFLFQYSSHESCRSAFYRAVEECPWVKALYIDGAKMLPSEIQQVQDLIIEKELRLHVTPEELDILRSKT